MDLLGEKQEKLKNVEEDMKNLSLQLDEAVEKSKILNAQVQECEVKLIRAQQLIRSLGAEQKRWTNTSKELA